MSQSSPFPYDTPSNPETVDRETGKKTRSPYLAQELVDWLLEQQQRTSDSPQQLGVVSLTAQGASIATTPVNMPAITVGLYRVTVYGRITRPGTVSSSLTITIGFTDGGVSCSFSTTALTTNTTASVVTQSFLVRSDASVAISYATSYASAGATTMQHSLDVVVEAMPG